MKTRRKWFIWLLLLVVGMLHVAAVKKGQEGPRYLKDAKGQELLKQGLAKIKQRLEPALKQIAGERSRIIQQWIRIAETPAPSKREQKRAAIIKQHFLRAGLQVSTDKLGNLIGFLPGVGSKKQKAIAFMAHMDTVFDDTISHRVRRVGTRLYGPGVGDCSAGLINLVTLTRMIKAHKLTFKQDLYFVASVQEEIGLVGSTAFINKHRAKLGMVVSVDGGFGGISYGALGIEWVRVAFRGKGNHTLSSMGKPSTTHAVAKAIQRIYRLRVPRKPLAKMTWYNIGKLGAGRVVNAQAEEAWFTLDLRSISALELTRMKQAIFGIVASTAYEVGVGYSTSYLQRTPAAQIPNAKELYLVHAAKAVLVSLGVKKPRMWPGGASDHCPAVALGIPGINIGTVRGHGAHTVKEWVDTTPLVKGLQQTLLLASVLAQLAP